MLLKIYIFSRDQRAEDSHNHKVLKDKHIFAFSLFVGFVTLIQLHKCLYFHPQCGFI